MTTEAATVADTGTDTPDTLDTLVARWEGGMTRVATYKLPFDTHVHITRTERGTYWTLCYFLLGVAPNVKWQVSADASNVDAEAAMKAVELRLS